MRQTQCTLSTNSCKRALTMIDEPLRDYRDSTFSKGLRLTWRRPTELTWPCIRARKIQSRLRGRGFAGLARAARHAASAPRARRFPSRPRQRSSAGASVPLRVAVCLFVMLRQETWSFPRATCRTDHFGMKILTNVSRFLLGLIFLVFGLNGFLHFIPMPPPSGVAGQFLGAMFVSKYLLVVSGLQVI